MESEHIKDIQEAIEKESKWTTKKLVFEIDEVTMINIIPYLSGGLKLHETLSFPNPSRMTQKKLIGGFKRETARQGEHLTQTSSSSKVDSQHGRFFKLACGCYCLYYPTANTTKKRTNLDAPVPTLYQTGVKLGSIRYTKKHLRQKGHKNG
jgi:hypothetical protein